MMICGYALNIFAILFVYAIILTIEVLNGSGVFYRN